MPLSCRKTVSSSTPLLTSAATVSLVKRVRKVSKSTPSCWAPNRLENTVKREGLQAGKYSKEGLQAGKYSKEGLQAGKYSKEGLQAENQ